MPRRKNSVARDDREHVHRPVKGEARLAAGPPGDRPLDRENREFLNEVLSYASRVVMLSKIYQAMGMRLPFDGTAVAVSMISSIAIFFS